MLQACFPPQITKWRSAKTCSDVRSLSELSLGAQPRVSLTFFQCIIVSQVFASCLSSISSCVLAGIHLLLSHTRLTLHVAAPAYLAVAGQAGEAHGRVVATSAAQALTAGVFGARPPARTRGVA